MQVFRVRRPKNQGVQKLRKLVEDNLARSNTTLVTGRLRVFLETWDLGVLKSFEPFDLSFAALVRLAQLLVCLGADAEDRQRPSNLFVVALLD